MRYLERKIAGLERPGTDERNRVVSWVLERGVELQCASDDAWLVRAAEQPKPVPDLREFASRLGLRPVLSVLTTAMGRDYPLTFVPITRLHAPDGRVLDAMHGEMRQAFPYSRREYFDDCQDLYYAAGAVIYHCKRLAQAYSDACWGFVTLSAGIPREHDKVGYGGGAFDSYFEFDALMTTVRRTYEAIRPIIWRAYGGNGSSRPRNFAKTFELCDSIPEHLRVHLQNSWSQFGVKATNYRDCALHYVPFDSSLGQASMERTDGGIWTTTVRIPANPEVRSKAAFRYSLGSSSDALTYGWEAAADTIVLASLIANHVASLDQPQIDEQPR